MSNNDPIKEIKPFRWGIDNDELNSSYSDDLHDCSTDLSDEGSRKEEREHAEFAKRKKMEMLNKKYGRSSKYTSYTAKTQTNLNVYSKLFKFAIFLFAIYMIACQKIDQIDFSKTYENETSVEEVYNPVNVLTEEMKTLIDVQSIALPNGKFILRILNDNDLILNNIEIQSVFYDEANNPIKICSNTIDTLFYNGLQYCEVSDIPEEYVNVNFVINQTSIRNLSNIDSKDIKLNVTQNDNNFRMRVINNSDKKIQTAQIAIIYFKNSRIVDFDTNNIYQIQANSYTTDTMRNFVDNVSYDDIQFIINDIWVYE